MVGPIEASSDSSYFLYLPTTLVEGIEPPIVFWTGWNRATRDRMQPFVEIAELTGVALAASVESKNGPNAFEVNNRHTEACLKHIRRNFPIDVKRAFFSGSSGGGATAFYNSGKLDCAGAMPMVAYIPTGTKPNKKGFYYVVGGANDYNRYASVTAVDTLGERASYRMHTGGHHRPITPAMAFEGTLWLYSRHLYEKPDRYQEELSHFEPRLLKWLTAQSKSSPHTAYFWTDHFLNTCKVEGSIREPIQALATELAKAEKNKIYLKAHRALEDFGLTVLLSEATGGSQSKHTSPAIQKGVKELQVKYADLPEIGEILVELAKPTDSH